jgi:hypothetical protein
MTTERKRTKRTLSNKFAAWLEKNRGPYGRDPSHAKQSDWWEKQALKLERVSR